MFQVGTWVCSVERSPASFHVEETTVSSMLKKHKFVCRRLCGALFGPFPKAPCEATSGAPFPAPKEMSDVLISALAKLGCTFTYGLSVSCSVGFLALLCICYKLFYLSSLFVFALNSRCGFRPESMCGFILFISFLESMALNRYIPSSRLLQN